MKQFINGYNDMDNGYGTDGAFTGYDRFYRRCGNEYIVMLDLSVRPANLANPQLNKS